MSHSETLTFVCGKLLFNKQKPKMILWMFFEDRAWWILYVLKWDFAVNPLLSYLTDPIIEHVSGNLARSIYLPIYPKSHQSPGWALRCAMISAAPPPHPPWRVGACKVSVCASVSVSLRLWPSRWNRSGCAIWAGGDHGYWLTFGTMPSWACVSFK